VRQSKLVCEPWYRDTYIGSDEIAVDSTTHFLERSLGDVVDPTPLFDGHWYRTIHGLHSVVDPLDHYLTTGASLGLDPSPVFDSIWYLRQVGDIADGMTALEHYLSTGGYGGIDPHPLFSTAWYLQQVETDLEGLTPLEHYLAFGWRRNLDPCELFSANGYLHRNPDVAAGGVNPFVHYLKFGSSEGREGTHLWTEAEYREWFADDVLVQRLGSLAHFRQVAGPGGKKILADPVIDRVAQLRVSLNVQANRVLRTTPGGERPPWIDWSARLGALEFPVCTEPTIAVVVAGRGHNALRTLETLSSSSLHQQVEVVFVSNKPFAEPIAGLRAIDANPIDLHAVWTAALSVTTAPYIVFLDSAIDVSPEWLDSLMNRMKPGVGIVASMIVGDDLSLQEAGRAILDDGAVVRIGADDRVGRWMYGVEREIDSCSPYGCLVRRSLLEEWLSSTKSAPFEVAGELLSSFVRGRGETVVFAPRSVLVERFAIDVRSRADSSPLVEQLRRRDRRSGPHVLVVVQSVASPDGVAGSTLGQKLLEDLVVSGRIVHVLPSDGRRVQPQTENLEDRGIEVIDAPLGSEELLAFVRSLRGRLEFVLVADPLAAVRWASFLLEHLGDIPLVYDATNVDLTDERNRLMEVPIARISDVVLADSSDKISSLQRRVGSPLASVVALSDDQAKSSHSSLDALFEAISAVNKP